VTRREIGVRRKIVAAWVELCFIASEKEEHHPDPGHGKRAVQS
jgi:hypothetical protein